MKNPLLLFAAIIVSMVTQPAFSQGISELVDYKQRLEKRQKVLTDSIKLVTDLVTTLNDLESKHSHRMQVPLNSDAYVARLDADGGDGSFITMFNRGDTVTLYELEENWYTIRRGYVVGAVPMDAIDQTKAVKKFNKAVSKAEKKMTGNVKSSSSDPMYGTSSSSTSKSYSRSRSSGNHSIQTGPRGGKYYINSKGKKTYVKKKKY